MMNHLILHEGTKEDSQRYIFFFILKIQSGRKYLRVSRDHAVFAYIDTMFKTKLIRYSSFRTLAQTHVPTSNVMRQRENRNDVVGTRPESGESDSIQQY